jgi:sulfite reductase beta subunit-like hemoprotein
MRWKRSRALFCTVRYKIRAQTRQVRSESMAQYTFSFINSEYERIPADLRKQFDDILADAEIDPAVTRLIGCVCDCTVKAVADLAKYSKDQLHMW